LNAFFQILCRQITYISAEPQVDARLKEVAASQVESQNAQAAAQQAQEVAQAALTTERRRAAELQAALTDALHTLKDTQASLEGLRRNGEDERARLRSDLERAVAAETRWLRELDHAREDAKVAAREAKAVHQELSREKVRRQRLAEELLAEKRDAKTRIAALERQLIAQRRVLAPAKTERRTKTSQRRPRRATTHE
jgi:chromosome segregation ATPase